mgnify:CR=1 FL=1
MKISVMIITYNRKREILRALESCVCNKIEEMEFVIVDNNSSDGTQEAVEKFFCENKKEEKDVHDFLYTELEESMKQILGSKVSIKNKKNNKGKIEIEYYSRDELERIVDMIRSI